MPAFVMDSESYTFDVGEEGSTRERKMSSLGLSRVTSAPDSIRPGFLRSVEARHPDPKSPGTLRDHHFHTDVGPHNMRWTTAGSVRLDPLAERPEKRPRLDQDLDTTSGKTFKRGHALETSSPIVGSNWRHPQSNISPNSSSVSEQGTRSPCFNCWGSEGVISSIVQGVVDLQLEIARALPIKPPPKIHESYVDDVTKQGLKHSLGWTLNELIATLETVRNISAATRPGLPSLADVVPDHYLGEAAPSSQPGQTSVVATPTSEERPLTLLTDSSRPKDHAQNFSESSKDQTMSSYDPHLPPTFISTDMLRNQVFESKMSGSAQSPNATSNASFGPRSPNQTHRSSRTLPSPPNAQFPSPSFPSSSQFSAASVQAAHTSHLQDLQHQISTKTLALQTLQREHDQLLAAFSRSQIRCNTLDKKSQVSDHEINTLSEEKIRLQQQVETLEANVEELIKSRDEVHQQSSADGAQWRQIMAMSSQLQIKGAEDARKHKADREAWEEDRAALEARIRDLEVDAACVSNVGRTPSAAEVEGESPDSTGADSLRQEVVRLRRKCAEMEKQLQDLSGETQQIDNAINAMASLRERLAVQRQQDLTS